MRYVLQRIVNIAVLMAFGVAILSRATASPPAAPADVQKPSIAVTISKETTHVTEPLRADGYVDYIGALNQRCSQRVTPENNAAVLVWRAVGPGTCEAADRDLFFKMLGIPSPPEKGDYFIPFDQYFEQSGKAKSGSDVSAEKQKPDRKPSEPELPMGVPVSMEEAAKLFGGAKSAEEEAFENQVNAATSRPWTAKEFPKFADWLAANEKPLASAIQVTRRSRYYDPLIAPANAEYGMIVAPRPTMQQSRELARALVPRAMLRLGEGKINEAWEDLLACHLLARFIGQGPMLTEALVSGAINRMACVGERALVQHADLSAAQIAKMQDDLNKLPPAPKVADKIDEAERFTMLDSLLTMVRDQEGKAHSDTKLEWLAKALYDLRRNRGIDWDLVLRTENPWYDRMADACRQPTRAQRLAAFDKIDEEFYKKVAELNDKVSMVIAALTNPRPRISECMAYANLALLLPAGPAAVETESLGTMDFDLTRLAFALASYRADNGSYPERLAQLAPKYIATVPEDVFAVVSVRDLLPNVAKSVARAPQDVFRGTALHYTSKDGGYVLYSVGRNGVDNGGRGSDDCTEGHEDMFGDWDDLVVRMPAAPQQRAKP